MSKVLNWKIIPIFLLIMVSSIVAPTSSAPVLLKQVSPGDEPVIDGNMTTSAAEWQESVTFNSTINGDSASIFVTSNSTDLYLALNYTDSNYIPVNGTSYNSTTNLNLEGHDWLAVQFDNNLDQEYLGTVDSPDDAIVANQYNESIWDAYMTGNASQPFTYDAFNNGTNDGSFAFANVSNSLVYEFSKPIKSDDINGSDLDDHASIFQFKINSFVNASSNSTVFESTEWFTVRVNVNGTGVALKTVEELKINLSILDNDIEEYDALQTVLDQFGFDVTLATGSLLPDDGDLNLVILPSVGAISQTQVNSIITSLELGGRYLLSIGDGGNASNLYDGLDLDYLSNSIIQNDVSNELEFKSGALKSLPYTSGVSLASNVTATNLVFTAGAFNTSSLENRTQTPFFLRQDFMKYSMLDMSGTVYDEDDNLVIDAGESQGTGLEIATAWDLRYGGRLGLISSGDIFADDYFASNGNMYYLLRALPWYARLINTLEIHSVEVDTHILNKTESVTVTVNATDGFGETVDGAYVDVYIIRGTGAVSITRLSLKNGLYTGSIQVNATGSMSVSAVAKYEGYGFANGEQQQLYVDSPVASFNDLSDVSPWLVLIFVVSIVVAVFTYIKTKSS